MSCNKVANTVNSAAGHIIFNLGAGLAAAATAVAAALTGGVSIVAGGLIYLGTVGAQIGISHTKSRLTEAKVHLIVQIQELIKKNRISKLGLITFNQ